MSTLKLAGDATTPPQRRPMLFVIAEGGRPLAGGLRLGLRELEGVRIGRGDERSATRRVEANRRELVLNLPDAAMSSSHAWIARTGATWTLYDAGSTNGTRVNGEVVRQRELADGDVIEMGRTFAMLRLQRTLSREEKDDLDAAAAGAVGELQSLVPEIARDLATLARVATATVPVVLRGETGTGKELAARAVHEMSRRAGDFVAVNCGAIPASLVEAELFGAERGAYSGATEARRGLIRAADRGTLFLDEIGDLPAPAQAALLRALQERQVLPVGATRPVPVEFRLVSATHRDLDALVAAGTFREDLLARLAGHHHAMAPLRERKEDLGLILRDLLRRCGAESLTVSADALRAIVHCDWPRNVRQLATCIQAAVAVADGQIELPHVAGHVSAAPDARAPAAPDLTDAQRARRDELIALLRQHKGNVSAVARAMNRVRSQVQRWLRRYALDPRDYR